MNDVDPGSTHRRLIEWTGERCVPWTGDLQVVYEHYHRYLLARPLTSGRQVLDLASGEGYGSALLAVDAGRVVGLEIDPASVEHSRRTYQAPGLEFVEGSMLDLSAFSDGSFDVVTCFEALEHVVEHDELLAGVRRVLAPDGVFVTSTPDRLRYTEDLHQHNPHHLRELSRDEFVELLGGVFAHVKVWGQAVAVGSLVQEVDATSGPTQVLPLAQVGEDWALQDGYPPTYFIAAASDREIPPMPAQSVLVDVDLTLVRATARELAERTAELAERTAELDGARADVKNLKGALDSLRADHDELATHLGIVDERDARARERLGVLERERDEALAQVVEAHAITGETASRLAAARRELDMIASSRLHRGATAIGRVFGRVRG